MPSTAGATTTHAYSSDRAVGTNSNARMNKRKIINDPVYGFVTISYDIVFDLVEHPWFQRLRRVKQLALTHYVYPGAMHTRFHHALGALHLMSETIDILRSKGVEITEEEAEAVSIAILLHDIGHGPFSHALEHTLMEIHHEDLSLLFMEKLNEQFDGRLTFRRTEPSKQLAALALQRSLKLVEHQDLQSNDRLAR